MAGKRDYRFLYFTLNVYRYMVLALDTVKGKAIDSYFYYSNSDSIDNECVISELLDIDNDFYKVYESGAKIVIAKPILMYTENYKISKTDFYRYAKLDKGVEN